MYALIIGRALPEEKTGMMGIFEFEQAVALRKQGLKTVYAFCDTRSIKLLRKINYTTIIKEDVSVYGYHFPIGGLPKFLFDRLKENKFKKILKRIVHEQGLPDVIHIHFPLLNLTSKIWEELKKLNRPIIITEHWSKIQTKEIEAFRIELLDKVVRESNVFMCVGEQLKRSILELTGTDKKIPVMPNMITSHFYHKQDDKEECFFKFITIGRLVESKRVELLVEAFTEVFKEGKNVTLEIVGDGTMFNTIQKQIRDLKMTNKITMHGFLSRESTADLLRESDAFVSASILETFGVPFIEAMACGKPVIGIKNGPIDSYINKSNGILYKQNDMKDLGESMMYIFNNRNEYDEQIISKHANKYFSEGTIINQLKEIYTNSITSKSI